MPLSRNVARGVPKPENVDGKSEEGKAFDGWEDRGQDGEGRDSATGVWLKA
jgi:hypothetical protein